MKHLHGESSGEMTIAKGVFRDAPIIPVVKFAGRFAGSTGKCYDRKMECKKLTRAQLSAFERLRKNTTFNALSRGFTKPQRVLENGRSDKSPMGANLRPIVFLRS